VCAEAGSTLIFVSHDRQLEPMFDRAVSLPELNDVGRGTGSGRMEGTRSTTGGRAGAPPRAT